MSVKAAAWTVLAPITWGTTFVLVTEVLPAERPLLDAAVRVLPAGIVLALIAWWLRRGRPGRADLGRIALLGMLNFGLFFPLLILAASRLPGGVAAASGGLQPLLVVGMTAALDRRRPRTQDLAVGVVAAAGVALVVLRPGAGYDTVGLLVILVANVSFAAGVVLTRRFPQPADPVGETGWQLLTGGLLLVPLALVVEGAPPALTAGEVAGFAYFSLVGTALAYLLWFEGIRRLPVVAPPLLGLAAPLTGAVLGWVLLGQDLTALQILGFAVTIVAIAHGALAGRPAARRPAEPAAAGAC